MTNNSPIISTGTSSKPCPMEFLFEDRVVTSGMIVRIDTKIKRKNKDLRQILHIFKYPINKDLQKMVSVVS